MPVKNVVKSANLFASSLYSQETASAIILAYSFKAVLWVA